MPTPTPSTSTFSPILIYQPGGGVAPGTPATTPPVYSQADVTQLIQGQAYIDVVFGSVQVDEDWVLVACEVENTTDFEPLNIWPGIITDRTAAGFRLQLNGMPDSSNYYLHWAVSGINIAPTPATTFIMSGPTSGFTGVPLTFTVNLPASTTVPGLVTVTMSDSGGGGTFSPAMVTLTTGTPSTTFTYTPGSIGLKTISATNNGGLLNPASIVVTVVLSATGYSLSGPSSGATGTPSTAFTVTLTPAGGAVTGSVTITLSDGGGGGTFTPTTVNLTTAAPASTFTYTPVSAGAKTISTTNSGGLTDPGSLTYTAAAFDPSSITGCKLWLKADSLALSDGTGVATWADSSANGNNATQSVALTRPVFKTAIVNGKPVIRFVAANSNTFDVAGSISSAPPWTVIAVMSPVAGANLVPAGNLAAAKAFAGIFTSGVVALDDGTTLGSHTFGGAVAWSGFHVFAYSVPPSGSPTVFVDGVSDSLTPVSASNGPATFVAIGVAAGVAYCSGDIAEILIYNVALSTTDRQNVESYLRTKYATP